MVKCSDSERMLKRMTIQPGSVVKRTKNVVFSLLGDEVLAIDAEDGYCYSMNETAYRIWELILSPMTIEDICIHLRKQYRVDKAMCEKEVTALLQTLSEAGLVIIHAR